MSWLRIRDPSLLDTLGKWPAEWWLIYDDTDAREHWWCRWLKPGFRHVLALRRDGRVWVAVKPTTGFVDIEVLRTDATPWQLFPSATVQRVVALREANTIRSRLFVGPLTCVEVCKALLGIRAWWLRTPWQLHRFCGRRLQCR